MVATLCTGAIDNREAWMGEWQPIETAPKNGVRVLCADGDDVATAEWTNARWVVSPTVWEGDGEYGGLADLEFSPTHWMPLPEPPR